MDNSWEVGWFKSDGTITIDSKLVSSHCTQREAIDAWHKYAEGEGFEFVHTEGDGYYSKGLERLVLWAPYGENE